MHGLYFLIIVSIFSITSRGFTPEIIVSSMLMKCVICIELLHLYVFLNYYCYYISIHTSLMFSN